jgi:hypothetical protein
MDRLNHLRPDLVVLLLIDYFVARLELHYETDAVHGASILRVEIERWVKAAGVRAALVVQV